MNYPRILTAALCLALLAGVLAAGVSSSAAFGAYNPSWDGTSELRSLAGEEDVETTFVRPGEELGDPDDSVAVVLAPDDAADPERLREFAANGGTVVVAADFGSDANELLAAMNASARIDGRLLRDEQRFYRGPAMPRATNVSEGPLTEGVGALTLNFGTGLDPGDGRVLVRTSPYAYYDTNRNDALDDAERLGRRPVAVAEPLGEGRLITVGDPSVFINAMLERSGNRAFARNLLAGADRLSLVVGDGALPPLVAALITLRGSVLLRILLGVGALGVLAVWARVGFGPVLERLRGSEAPKPDPDAAALAATLRERHPEWSAERVERVTTAVKERRGEGRDND